MKQSTIITIVAILLVGAGAFYAGMKYQQRTASQLRGQFVGRNGRVGGTGNNRFGGGGRPVLGEVLKVDTDSITVKMPDGSSKIVMINAKTSINKASQASKSELKEGMQVAAFGTDNSDGSQTAVNIQLNPQMRTMGGGQPPSP